MKWNPIKLIQITPQPHHPNPRKSFKNFGGNEVNSTPDFSERRNQFMRTFMMPIQIQFLIKNFLIFNLEFGNSWFTYFCGFIILAPTLRKKLNAIQNFSYPFNWWKKRYKIISPFHCQNHSGVFLGIGKNKGFLGKSIKKRKLYS